MRTKCIAAKQNFLQIWALQIFCFSLQNFPVPFNICLYRSPKKEVYWQVASNIFPKAWTKKNCQFVNPFLPIQYKNGSGNSHPIPSWKLRECAGETGSDSGVNKKKDKIQQQYEVTGWHKKPHFAWQQTANGPSLQMLWSLWACSVKHC